RPDRRRRRTGSGVRADPVVRRLPPRHGRAARRRRRRVLTGSAMADGTHCPECGEDVGFWAVARSLFGVRCPHCGARLRHQLSPGMGALTTAGALGSVVAALVVAAAAGWAVGVRAGPVAGLAVGAAVCWVLAFAV